MPVHSSTSRPLLNWLNRSSLIAIILWMVVLLLFTLKGENRYIYLFAHYVLLPLILGVNILTRMFKTKELPLLRLGWVDLSMVIYLGFVIVSVLMNDELQGGSLPHLISVYRRIFVPFSGYWLVRSFHPSEKDIETLTLVMMVLCIVECAAGLIAWFWPEMLPGIWPGRVEQYGGFRTTGTLTQPDVYSGALIFFLTFLFHYAMTRSKGFYRFLLIVLFDLGIFCIFLSYSRASWLSAIIVLIILACLYTRTFLFYVLPSLMVWPILLMTILAQEGSYATERAATVETVGDRVIIGLAGIKMFHERPIFGWGYGTYDEHDYKFMEGVGRFEPSEWDIKEATSHNTFLTILTETGIVGFFLYTFPMAWWFVLTIKRWRRLDRGKSTGAFFNRRFLVILWANICFILIISQLIDIRFFPFTLVQTWLILGLIANMVETHLHQKDAML